jgi:hypothetical protein
MPRRPEPRRVIPARRTTVSSDGAGVRTTTVSSDGAGLRTTTMKSGGAGLLGRLHLRWLRRKWIVRVDEL